MNKEINKCWIIFFFKGIIERDQIVFQEARQRGIPIFMLTSGGYQVEKWGHFFKFGHRK